MAIQKDFMSINTNKPLLASNGLISSHNINYVLIMKKDNECPITNILFVDGDNKFETVILEALTQYQADNQYVDIIVSSVGVNATDGEDRSLTVH